LKLLHFDNMLLVSEMEEYDQGPKHAVRAEFYMNGVRYKLKVTDPNFSDIGLGRYDLSDVVVCISLGEVYEKTGFAYKLVASIIR